MSISDDDRARLSTVASQLARATNRGALPSEAVETLMRIVESAAEDIEYALVAYEHCTSNSAVMANTTDQIYVLLAACRERIASLCRDHN